MALENNGGSSVEGQGAWSPWEGFLCVPQFVRIAQDEEGFPEEDVWQRAQVIDRFIVWPRGDRSPKVATEVRLFLDREAFYCRVTCDEPEGVDRTIRHADLDANPWAGDNLELFLAAQGEHSWYRQIVLGANGDRNTEFISDEDYQCRVDIRETSWRVDLKVPLSCLGPMPGGRLLFNLSRWSSFAHESLTWQKVNFFHDGDKFGVLQLFTPEDEIAHGPWNYGIEATCAGINWETVGACGGQVRYGKQGEGRTQVVLSNVKGGVQQRNQRLHPVFLTGLEPDTVYEYEVGHQVHSFRTLSDHADDFRATATSDLHCRSAVLKKIMGREASRKADLLFMLGDMVSGSMWRDVTYDAYLDALVSDWDRPFYVIRGNHDYRGGAAGNLLELFPVNGERSYYRVLHKGVCFVLLDTDGDWVHDPSYVEEEKLWLQEVVRSREFQQADFRVLMAHCPLFYSKQFGGKEIVDLVQSLSEEATSAFDLMLAGHIHSYCRLMPGDERLYSTNKAINQSAPVMHWPFPVLVNECQGCFQLTKTSEALRVDCYGPSGEQLIDSIEIKKNHQCLIR